MKTAMSCIISIVFGVAMGLAYDSKGCPLLFTWKYWAAFLCFVANGLLYAFF